MGAESSEQREINAGADEFAAAGDVTAALAKVEDATVALQYLDNKTRISDAVWQASRSVARTANRRLEAAQSADAQLKKELADLQDEDEAE